MKYFNFVLIFIIFLLILIIYYSNKVDFRCTEIGEQIFDDFFGFKIAQTRCLEYQKSNSNPYSPHGPKFEEITPRYQNTRLKKEIECPKNSDVIIILGQSNAANYLINYNKIETDHLNYYNDKCYKLTDPVLGATGNLQSLAPVLADKIISKKPVIFLTNAWGGSNISQWSMSESKLSEYANRNMLKLSKNNNLKFIIWIQGESDANKKINYKKHFLDFKKNILKNLNESQKKLLKFIITQTSICGSDARNRDKKLNRYQKNLGKLKNTFVTDVTDNLNFNYRYDTCHFNQFGIDKITDEISEIINNNL